MLNSVKTPFAECAELLKANIKLDPGFKSFYLWCKAHGVPIIIVSSGMEPLIRAVLSGLLGEEEAKTMEIIANDVKFTDEAQKGETWEIVFRWVQGFLIDWVRKCIVCNTEADACNLPVVGHCLIGYWFGNPGTQRGSSILFLNMFAHLQAIRDCEP